ncbi:MAG: hypothetical protein HYX92_13940 [Chloroflexi bacterium]|nr:hypothetical protein [Chloroflexota bacterium]
MENNYQASLEKALAKTEADADATLKAADSTVKSLKRLRANAQAGSLRDLKKTMESAEMAIAALKQQFMNMKESWDFDCENYVASHAYVDEILEMSRSLGVGIFQQDERLYCYPSLIRILPNDLAVQIDKKKERTLRPSALVTHLKTLQDRPVRFKADAFLESLFSAYEILMRSRGKDQVGKGIVVRLLEVYSLLTLLPGQSRDYSIQEFGRDLYLLDQSGVARTKGGLRVSFPASTGTRSMRGAIRVITREGQEKRYYGISFIEG